MAAGKTIENIEGILLPNFVCNFVHTYNVHKKSLLRIWTFNKNC